MSSPVLPAGGHQPKDNPRNAAPARDQPNWGEVVGISIAAAVGTVGCIAIAFFLLWIRRKFFAPAPAPPPPPPIDDEEAPNPQPPPPPPHGGNVLQWVLQHGVYGGGEEVDGGEDAGEEVGGGEDVSGGSDDSMNVHVSGGGSEESVHHSADEGAESVASCSFTGGGGAGASTSGSE
jgi:hypothetical protein